MNKAARMDMKVQERDTRLELDDVTYIINLANASPALEMVFSLGTLFEDMAVGVDAEGEVKELPIGKVLSHLNSPEFKSLRKFLIDQVNVSRDGADPYRLKDRYDDHLNAYPHHYMPLIWRSFRFQFARFFLAGGAAASLIPAQLRSIFGAK